MAEFKPTLASDADLDNLKYPILASPKLDGIRAIVRDSQVWTRSLKLVPNRQVQERFGYAALNNLDSELIVGAPTSKTVYRDTVSAVMAHDRPNCAKLYVFDHIEFPDTPYSHRSRILHHQIRMIQHEHPDVVILPHDLVMTPDGLLQVEAEALAQGYEGLILRDPEGRYKFGRSTTKEGILLKLKRFTDAEATVIGFEERMHNANEATINELGHTHRSSHKANLQGRGDLGALRVRIDLGAGPIEFNVGTGFDDSTRAEIWANREKYIGASAKLKYFAIGMKDAPRHPVFLGWRLKEDQ